MSTYIQRRMLRKVHRIFWVARMKTVNAVTNILLLVAHIISEVTYKDRSMKTRKIGGYIMEGYYD